MALPRIESYQLFNGQTANATSASFPVAIPAGCSVYTSGGFGGGNVQMQFSPDGGTTWVNVGATITTATVTEFLQSATAVRAVLAGATAATLSLWVVPKDFN